MSKPCFRCDGTGKICNICGESEKACSCDATEIEEHEADGFDQFDDCEDCKGTGKQ
jgi:hypothetical protein